jgi:hypothetical protein
MDDKEYGSDAERAELISQIKLELDLLRFLLAQHASQLSDQSVEHLDEPPPPYTQEQGQAVPSTEVTIPSIPSGRVCKCSSTYSSVTVTPLQATTERQSWERRTYCRDNGIEESTI